MMLAAAIRLRHILQSLSSFHQLNSKGGLIKINRLGSIEID